MPYKVLLTSRSFRQSPGQHWDILNEAGCELVESGVDRSLTEDEMLDKLADVEGAILGVDPVTQRVVRATRRLRAISRQGVGVDSVDLPACTARGIIVTNTPGASTGSVSELALALILALLRHIPQHDRLVKAGKWSRLLGSDLAGKTVGLVGFGRIARDLAHKLQAFDAPVLYFDPNRPRPEEEQALDVRYADLGGLLAQADVVSLHAIVTPETVKLINRDRLGLMKPGAILVNTARGELVDEDALFEALQSKRLAAAASDVFVREPPAGSPLLGLDNFIASPHCGPYTAETNERVAVAAAQNLVDALCGRQPLATVNPEVYSLDRLQSGIRASEA